MVNNGMMVYIRNIVQNKRRGEDMEQLKNLSLRFIKEHHKRKTWQRVKFVLAMFVFF